MDHKICLGILGGSVVAACIYLYLTTPSTSKTKKRSQKLCGLYNLGNTCYANALIQGLACVPSVLKWLKSIDCVEENAFVSQLKKLILELESGSETTLSAHNVNCALMSHGWAIQYQVEHDLHELLNVFISTWEDELTEAKKKILSCSLSQLPSLVHRESYDRRLLLMEHVSQEIRLDSNLRSPISGVIAVQLKCIQQDCGYKKVRHENCSVLELAIPHSMVNTVTLDFLLRCHFRMEHIRGASCDGCRLKSGRTSSGLLKKQGFAKLKTCIAVSGINSQTDDLYKTWQYLWGQFISDHFQLPSCLILRIERVGRLPSGSCFKISQHVDFPVHLEVRDYCFYRPKAHDFVEPNMSKGLGMDNSSRIVGGGENQSNSYDESKSSSLDGVLLNDKVKEMVSKYKYELCGVSEHRGNADSGHFVTYRRGTTQSIRDSWFLTSDAKITRVSLQDVLSAQAYMLYYQRVRDIQ